LRHSPTIRDRNNARRKPVLTALALVPFALSIAAAVCFARRKWNLGAMFLTLVLSCVLAGGVALAFSGDYLLNQLGGTEPLEEGVPTDESGYPDPAGNDCYTVVDGEVRSC
jgi:hypothetical protein